MCEPISLGLLSAGSGILGAVGANEAANAQVDAQNQQIATNYKQKQEQTRLANLQGITNYNNEKATVSHQIDEAGLAATRALNAEELRMDDLINKTRLAQQENYIRTAEAAKANEGGRARGYDTNRLKQSGRAESLLLSNLKRQKIASSMRVKDAYRNAGQEQRNLHAKVASPFVPASLGLPKPRFQSSPSPVSMMGSIVQAGIGGYQTYKNLKAPNPFA